MALSGHKTVSVFKRYNLVSVDELRDIRWSASEGRGDTYFDTRPMSSQKGLQPCFCNPLIFFGARSESRTRTPVRAVDFESTASTNSAIRARNRPETVSISDAWSPPFNSNITRNAARNQRGNEVFGNDSLTRGRGGCQ